METAETEINDFSNNPVLRILPVGAKLILRCRKDWREAVVSKFTLEKAVLSVVSKSGATYRVRRPIDAPFHYDGEIPVLFEDCDEIEWRENLLKTDLRW